MLKRVILLSDGDPRDRWAFSGITHYYAAALTRVCRQLRLEFDIVKPERHTNTEVLLRMWCSRQYARPHRSQATAQQDRLELKQIMQARTVAELATSLVEYYERTGACMRDLLQRRIRTGDFVLSLNPFYPHIGRTNFPLSFYLDCSVVAFYLHPLYGTVPDSVKVGSIRSALFEIERTTVGAASRVFTFSRFARNELVSLKAALPSHTEVVGAGINLSTFPLYRRRSLSGKISLLFVGRDFERKGGPVIIDAARLLDPSRFEIICVTNNPDRIMPQLPRNVQLMAVVSKKTLQSLFRRAQFFLAPTRHEPYGLAVAEAMAFSLPAVSSSVSAIPEILGPKNPGLLSRSPEPSELANRIQTLSGDSDLYARMALINYTRARLRFDWDRVAYRILTAAVRHRIWT